MTRNRCIFDGSLSMVQSKRNASFGYHAYASSFNYNAAGAVTSMQLGNGRWESTVFNSRLQPTRIALGSTGTGAQAYDLLKLDYGYGAANNNGNVLSQTITVPTVGQTPGFVASQTYSYDPLNRLKQATEAIGSSTTWQQTFTFDRYGNRNFDEANTTFEGFEKLCSNGTELCAELRKIMNPSVNTSDNRLSSSDDYAFDTSGNTTEDAEGRTFIYDGENKQVEVRDAQQNIIGEYRYDGDGRRIKKHVPSTGEVTVFVYDAGGKLIGEYSTIAETQSPKVSYTTADHLGSPRILTDQNGSVISRRDFHPFGEEIATSERHANLGYQSDDLRQKFTGYERDGETGLDFAQARYHDYNLGRFSSPDPLLASARRVNPQTFNRYSYVLNRPLSLVDPTGMVAEDDCKRKGTKCPDFYPIPDGGQAPGSVGDVTIYPEDEPIPIDKIAPIATTITFRPLQNTEVGFNSQNFATTMSTAPFVIGATAAAGTEEAPGIGTIVGAGIGLLGVLTAATLTSIEITTTTTTTTTTDPPSSDGPVYVRLGPGPETQEKLSEDAARAETFGFPHGVSVLLFKNTPPGSRSAPVSVAEAAFEIRKTGNRANHYTVVLPKPITPETTTVFNTVFAPR